MPIQSVLDAHCHTVASGHAYSTVSEYIAEAAKKGLKAIAITDHAPKMPGASGYLHFLNQPKLPRQINGVALFTGVELNILNENGKVDLERGIYKWLDVVMASLHVPCFAPTTEEIHTAAIINAMKNPLIKIIGHLGDPRYPFDIALITQTAKETGTAIEINNASLDPSNGIRTGGADIIKEVALECKRQSVPVIMGSDAHFHAEVGETQYAQQLLEDIDFPPELVLNRSVEAFTEFLTTPLTLMPNPNPPA